MPWVCEGALARSSGHHVWYELSLVSCLEGRHHLRLSIAIVVRLLYLPGKLMLMLLLLESSLGHFA